jgi:hypothetical protein
MKLMLILGKHQNRVSRDQGMLLRLPPKESLPTQDVDFMLVSMTVVWGRSTWFDLEKEKREGRSAIGLGPEPTYRHPRYTINCFCQHIQTMFHPHGIDPFLRSCVRLKPTIVIKGSQCLSVKN